jgi:hypothetical protein
MAAEQGPREAGMRPASSAGRRHVMRALRCDAKEAAPIAVEQGPRNAGTRPASGAGRRHAYVSVTAMAQGGGVLISEKPHAY